jgi:FKBP-type peptidyl-prolyl cis-trans isomerase FklB
MSTKIKFLLLVAFSFFLLNPIHAQSKVKLKNGVDSMSYCMGIVMGTNLKDNGGVNVINDQAFAAGIKEVMDGTTNLIAPDKAEAYLTDYFTKLMAAKSAKNLEEGKKFLEENKTKEGVKSLPNGIQYIVLKEGEGVIPTDTDYVSVNYVGTLIDGTVFDSSYDNGKPVTFPVNSVIQGWSDVLKLMKTGSKWKVFIPSDLAYGERGASGKIGPNAVLIFEIELLSIEQAPVEDEPYYDDVENE